MNLSTGEAVALSWAFLVLLFGGGELLVLTALCVARAWCWCLERIVRRGSASRPRGARAGSGRARREGPGAR